MKQWNLCGVVISSIICSCFGSHVPYNPREEIKGVINISYQFKVSLFADILLTHTTKTFYKAGALWFDINYTKSEEIPLNKIPFQSHWGATNFKWNPNGHEYVWIKIWSHTRCTGSQNTRSLKFSTVFTMQDTWGYWN